MKHTSRNFVNQMKAHTTCKRNDLWQKGIMGIFHIFIKMNHIRGNFGLYRCDTLWFRSINALYCQWWLVTLVLARASLKLYDTKHQSKACIFFFFLSKFTINRYIRLLTKIKVVKNQIHVSKSNKILKENTYIWGIFMYCYGC